MRFYPKSSQRRVPVSKHGLIIDLFDHDQVGAASLLLFASVCFFSSSLAAKWGGVSSYTYGAGEREQDKRDPANTKAFLC